MDIDIKPIAAINEKATNALIREVGIVDTIRYINQFYAGHGNYTEERREMVDAMSLDEIFSGIAAMKGDKTAQPTCHTHHREKMPMPTLSSLEIQQAQNLINSKPPGIYELSELYGPDWSNIDSPNTFGKNFKKTVEVGLLQNIRWNSHKSNNHHDYEILSR